MEEDTVVRLPRPGASVADDPLLEVLRSGARRMLQQVIEAEVEAFLAAHAELEDARGRRRVVRNGHAPEREIQTGIGPIAVRRPKLRDRGDGTGGVGIRFTSKVLPPFLRWAVIDANFTASNRDACTAGAACWGIVGNRFHQYLFGLYPTDQYWRIFLGAALLVAGCVPLLIRGFPRKTLYGVSFMIIYPFVAGWLFEGGGPLQPVVDTPLWGGLFLTLIISIVGIVASFPIGIALALGRRSQMPVIKALCVSFIELVRGVPLVTVLFMASVMLPLFFPPGWTIDKIMRALVGVSLFSGAYMAEVIRGGLQAIPKENLKTVIDESSTAVGGLGPELNRLVDGSIAPRPAA